MCVKKRRLKKILPKIDPVSRASDKVGATTNLLRFLIKLPSSLTGDRISPYHGGEMDMTSNPNQEKPSYTDKTNESASTDIHLEQLRMELLASSPEIIIANHCFGLFELAALYLSENPPRLIPATLAIDALAGLADALKGRLGGQEQEIRDGISQLRLAFIQVSPLADQAAEPS